MPLYGKLEIIKRDGRDGSVFPLTAQECIIGSGQGSDIRLALPLVSEIQCEIHVDSEKNEVVLKNKNKDHPTTVNNEKLGGDQSIRLKDRDIISIGDRSFRFIASKRAFTPLVVNLPLVREKTKANQNVGSSGFGAVANQATPRLKSIIKSVPKFRITPTNSVQPRSLRKSGQLKTAASTTTSSTKGKAYKSPAPSGMHRAASVKNQANVVTPASSLKRLQTASVLASGKRNLTTPRSQIPIRKPFSSTPMLGKKKPVQNVDISYTAPLISDGKTGSIDTNSNNENSVVANPVEIKDIASVDDSNANGEITKIEPIVQASPIIHGFKNLATAALASISPFGQPTDASSPAQTISTPQVKEIDLMEFITPLKLDSPNETIGASDVSTATVGMRTLLDIDTTGDTTRASPATIQEDASIVVAPIVGPMGEGTSADINDGQLQVRPQQTPKIYESTSLFADGNGMESPKKFIGTTKMETKSPMLKGLPELFKVEKARKSPRFAGIGRMFREEKRQKSPRLGGIRKLLKEEKPTKSPRLGGVSKLLNEPKPLASPKLAGIRRLLAEEQHGESPIVADVSKLFAERKKKKTEVQKLLEEASWFMDTPGGSRLLKSQPTTPAPQSTMKKNRGKRQPMDESNIAPNAKIESENIEETAQIPVGRTRKPRQLNSSGAATMTEPPPPPPPTEAPVKKNPGKEAAKKKGPTAKKKTETELLLEEAATIVGASDGKKRRR